MCKGESLNLDNPRTFNEKSQWLKIYKYNNKQIANLVDKYKVREYIKKRGLGFILNELYGVYDNAKEIDFDQLPKSFVLKCNHGSGFNIIIKDKNSVNKDDIITKLNDWLKIQYGKEYVETFYKHIDRKIICEKLIDAEDKNTPIDYKFFCSFGEVKFIYSMIGFDEIQDFYDDNWNWLPIKTGKYPNNITHLEKPKNLDQMKHYASILSRDFPLVRVDFYNEHNNITFGELTFLTTGGYTNFIPKEYNLKLGSMFPDLKDLKNYDCSSYLNKE